MLQKIHLAVANIRCDDQLIVFLRLSYAGPGSGGTNISVGLGVEIAPKLRIISVGIQPFDKARGLLVEIGQCQTGLNLHIMVFIAVPHRQLLLVKTRIIAVSTITGKVSSNTQIPGTSGYLYPAVIIGAQLQTQFSLGRDIWRDNINYAMHCIGAMQHRTRTAQHFNALSHFCISLK